MSVEQWKRVIALTVLAVIVGLTVIAIVLGVKLHNTKADFEKETIIDLEDYTGIGVEEGKQTLEYLNAIGENAEITYQELFPTLYVENDFQYKDTEEKVCYLTFDDGPTVDVTTRILDVLKESDIRATFFVIGKKGEEYEALYKRIVEEGHTIAIHTYSHDYEKIYESVESYLQDFLEISDLVENLTGVKPELFRFPGGSVNGYNAGIYQELIAEMIRRGYTYYDWNVASKDTVSGLTAGDILRNVSYTADEMDDDIIVLMHDGENHETTAEALPRIITDLKRQGYVFAGLDKDVKPVCFGY